MPVFSVFSFFLFQVSRNSRIWIEYAGMSVHEMSFSDKKLEEDDGGSVKKNKKKQKKQDIWRPERPKDPFAMVCVFVRV